MGKTGSHTPGAKTATKLVIHAARTHTRPVKFKVPRQIEIPAASSVSRLIISKVDNPDTETRAAQICSPGCVLCAASTSQAQVQILYRKFPLSSKNSRPLCTTLLLKFCSPRSLAFKASSSFALGNPSLSVPRVPSPPPEEYFRVSLC